MYFLYTFSGPALMSLKSSNLISMAAMLIAHNCQCKFQALNLSCSPYSKDLIEEN